MGRRGRGGGGGGGGGGNRNLNCCSEFFFFWPPTHERLRIKAKYHALPRPLYHHHYQQQSTMFALKDLRIADTNNI